MLEALPSPARIGLSVFERLLDLGIIVGSASLYTLELVLAQYMELQYDIRWQIDWMTMLDRLATYNALVCALGIGTGLLVAFVLNKCVRATWMNRLVCRNLIILSLCCLSTKLLFHDPAEVWLINFVSLCLSLAGTVALTKTYFDRLFTGPRSYIFAAGLIGLVVCFDFYFAAMGDFM